MKILRFRGLLEATHGARAVVFRRTMRKDSCDHYRVYQQLLTFNTVFIEPLAVLSDTLCLCNDLKKIVGEYIHVYIGIDLFYVIHLYIQVGSILYSANLNYVNSNYANLR